MRKFRIIAIILVLCVVVANIMLSQTDYANIVLVPPDNSYILLNDTQKYCFMQYYNYNHSPDLYIRDGKNFFLSLFKKRFQAFSSDSERNFLYCTQGGFGIQIYGLYIKSDSMDDLFKPTPENIYRVVVLDSDYNEVLTFNAKNTELFGWFTETYAYELNDYFFPINADDSDVFNEKYSVNIEYQNGEITRFLRHINEESFQIMYSKAGND